ncbi:MAG: carbon-nitrogen hydrolase family protein [Candidatus Latescibacterota bacterium]
MEQSSADHGLLLGNGAGEGEWTCWSPRSALSPLFHREPGRLTLEGGGNPHVFGAWCRRVPVTPEDAYRLRVSCRCSGVEDLGLHVTPHVVWRRGQRREDECAVDAVRALRQEGGCAAGEDLLVAPEGCDAAEVRLLLRFASGGRVTFDRVELVPSAPPAPRRVRVSTMRSCPPRGATLADHRAHYAGRIDEAAASRPDLVVVPEFANVTALLPLYGDALVEVAEEVPGPFCGMLAERAQRHCTCLCAGLLEREGDILFNAAVVYDPSGRLVARQRKVHPYWPEEPWGVSPGETFQAFDLPFGRAGIMICYDSWWPESARLLGLQGAEIILFPNAGYEERILPARAIDNNAYVVCASLFSPAAILDTRGVAVATCATEGVLTALIDLASRPKCHPNAGGNLNPGPGGARWARNARSPRIYDEIAAGVRRSGPPDGTVGAGSQSG